MIDLKLIKAEVKVLFSYNYNCSVPYYISEQNQHAPKIWFESITNK